MNAAGPWSPWLHHKGAAHAQFGCRVPLHKVTVAGHHPLRCPGRARAGNAGAGQWRLGPSRCARQCAPTWLRVLRRCGGAHPPRRQAAASKWAQRFTRQPQLPLEQLARRRCCGANDNGGAACVCGAAPAALFLTHVLFAERVRLSGSAHAHVGVGIGGQLQTETDVGNQARDLHVRRRSDGTRETSCASRKGCGK